MILLIYSMIIILLALTDSLFYKGCKSISKIIEEVSFAVILFTILLFKEYAIDYVVAIYIMYLMLRGAFFDFFFNIFSGLPYDYSGSTTVFWDKIMSYFKNWSFWLVRGFFFFLAWFVWYKKIK